MKEFFYNVNGTEFADTEAFGKAWREAKALAESEHTCITRTVVNNNSIKYEYFTNSGIFLDEKYYDKDNAKIF